MFSSLDILVLIGLVRLDRGELASRDPTPQRPQQKPDTKKRIRKSAG